MTPPRPGNFKRLYWNAAIFAAFFALAPTLRAETVTLSDGAGDLDLTAEVLGFDGRFLRVLTEHGELTVDYSRVECLGAACPDLQTYVPELRLSGAARLGELILPALVEGFAREQGWTAVRTEDEPTRFGYLLSDGQDQSDRIRFSFKVTTTEDGFADLLANETDLVMASRELTQAELDLAEQAGLGQLDDQRHLRVLALDALVPVVASTQPVRSITLPALARVLGEEITNWTGLGGADAPIVLHLSDTESGQVQGIASRLLGSSGLQLTDAVVLHPTLRDAADAIAGDPHGFGLLPFDDLGTTRPLALSGGCPLLLNPRSEAIRTEDYPLAIPLLLYLPSRRLTDEAAGFLAWLRTSEAQLVLRRAGVFSLDAAPVPLSVQGDRLAAAIAAAGAEITLDDLQRMIAFMRGRVRLTPTFRFEEGQARLNAVSRAQVLNLAQAILDGQYDGRVLALVGFSDGLGPASSNQVLATARAETVREAVLDALSGVLPERVTLETEAFGEALPIACDDSRWGRRANRRVELWVGAGRN